MEARQLHPNGTFEMERYDSQVLKSPIVPWTLSAFLVRSVFTPFLFSPAVSSVRGIHASGVGKELTA